MVVVRHCLSSGATIVREEPDHCPRAMPAHMAWLEGTEESALAAASSSQEGDGEGEEEGEEEKDKEEGDKEERGARKMRGQSFYSRSLSGPAWQRWAAA